MPISNLVKQAGTSSRLGGKTVIPTQARITSPSSGAWLPALSVSGSGSLLMAYIVAGGSTPTMRLTLDGVVIFVGSVQSSGSGTSVTAGVSLSDYIYPATGTSLGSAIIGIGSSTDLGAIKGFYPSRLVQLPSTDATPTSPTTTNTGKFAILVDPLEFKSSLLVELYVPGSVTHVEAHVIYAI